MFTTDFFIDTIQGLKRDFTNAVITDTTLNRAANDFIDAQTKFGKMLAQNTVSVSKYYVDTMSKCWFPHSK
jgi:hypothetical protein